MTQIKHPFLGIQELKDEQEVLQLRVTHTPDFTTVNEIAQTYSGKQPAELQAATGNKLSIRILKGEPGTEVPNLDEAEDIFLKEVLSQPMYENQIFDLNKVATPVGYGYDRGDLLVGLMILINRRANLIAARTRRGAGNVVLTHPNTVKIFKETNSTAYADTTIAHTFGNWTNAGCINSSIVVYTSMKVPENKVIVTYKGPGEMDAPAFFATNFYTDKSYFDFLKNNTQCLGNATDYIGIVELQNC
jgi:Major capsid protein Gp23